MAQTKRSAERPTTTQAKRQRISKNHQPTSTVQENQPAKEDELAAECHIDSQITSVADDKLAANFAERITAMKQHADQRKRWAKDFEAEVAAKGTALVERIESAKSNIEGKREAFRRSMLPILSAALQDLHVDPVNPAASELPLQVELAHTTTMVMKASQLLKSCQSVITCFEELAQARPTLSSLTNLRDIFARDKRALEVAATGARKMISNHVQSQIMNGHGKFQKRLTLNEEEERFGQKVLQNSKITHGKASTRKVVLEDVCREMNKVVGKMQHVIDIYVHPRESAFTRNGPVPGIWRNEEAV